MFDNIGSKIKGLAVTVFGIEAFASVILGIYNLTDDEFAIGIILLLVGPINAWVSSWLLYGFGELITKVCDIADSVKVAPNYPNAFAPKPHVQPTYVQTNTPAPEIMDIPKRNS
jgi:hypothetical protein